MLPKVRLCAAVLALQVACGDVGAVRVDGSEPPDAPARDGGACPACADGGDAGTVETDARAEIDGAALDGGGDTSWFGGPDPWAGEPFGSFPDAPPCQMWISGDQGGRTISRLTFRNRAPGENVIVLDGAVNLRIDLIDCDTVPECIYINESSDIEIGRIRARNIYGPFTRTLIHTGNLIQSRNGRRIWIHDVKVAQPHTVPAGYTAWGTEDIVSLGGDPGSWGGDSWTQPFLIERFAFDGGAWQSPSGTGFFVGDGASGRYVWIRDGILINPGQVGIGTAEEGPYRFERLWIVGEPRATSNDSIQLRTDLAAFGSVRTDWRRADGTRVAPNLDGHTFEDRGDNDWMATLDPAALGASLTF